ncbi:uncharacterized protein N7503_008657 [Penicillium pulvis]|uniref:uncharacterized protein n=1 Tax=Penicillium pulvis TaxID=1562058 RepID=UPI002548876B|nr:uncharacterized protein N7503_008657 [Penicillium pulvis]KAJ5792679.1 hypothetical protein N7503_008657 [Penicillium pulvis]
MSNIVTRSRIVLKKQRSSLDEGHKMPQQQVHSYVDQRSLRSQYRVGFGIAEDSREAVRTRKGSSVAVASWQPMD